MTYAAIIEWPGDAIEPPTLIVGPSIESLFTPLVEALQRMVDDGYADDPGFIAEHPYPQPDDESDQREWLLAMREATTVPWVELYVIDGPTATNIPIYAIKED